MQGSLIAFPTAVFGSGTQGWPLWRAAIPFRRACRRGGRRLMFDEREVDEWIASRERKPVDEPAWLREARQGEPSSRTRSSLWARPLNPSLEEWWKRPKE